MGSGSRHTWNFRVVHRVAEQDYVIGEVFYRGEHVQGWVPAIPGGDTVDEVQHTVALMIEAFMRPVLEESDVSLEGPNAPEGD